VSSRPLTKDRCWDVGRAAVIGLVMHGDIDRAQAGTVQTTQIVAIYRALHNG